MKNKEVPLYDYLSYDEAQELIEILSKNKILAKINGMTSGDASTQGNYQVLIYQSDIELPYQLAEEFRFQLKERRGQESQVCPKCKSRPPFTHLKSKLSWWRKILSTGTFVMECDKCHHVWYI